MMYEEKTFKRYNLVTGAVDGTLAYDFGSSVYYPQEEEEAESRPSRRTRHRRQEWVREKNRDEALAGDRRPGVSPMACIGLLAAVMLILMMLLAQIELVNVSNAAAALESQISELKTEQGRLTAEYETVFNLKAVEEYAVDVLGMQEPDESQISYLTNVSPDDKAVIIEQDAGSGLFLGFEDLVASVKAYKSYFD